MNLEQRDLIIGDIEQMKINGADQVTIDRLRCLLAGVENKANWLALYDTLEQAYVDWRITKDEAIDGLRWLGIDARTDIDEKPFGDIAERKRQQNAKDMKARVDAAFNAVDWVAVDWELRHYRRSHLTLVHSRAMDAE